MGGREVGALEGEYEGFYYSTLVTHDRTDTVGSPGPPPYTRTVTSIQTWLEQSLEKVELGKKVRITVEVVG
jgi:hypothetical protein